MNAYTQTAVNLTANIGSLSSLWKALHSEDAGEIARAIRPKNDSEAFKEFTDYLKKRHKVVETGKTPKRWSHWYAANWAIKEAKANATNRESKQQAAAVKFLTKNRLTKQAEAVAKH